MRLKRPQAVVLGGAEVAQRRVSPDRENGGHEEAGIAEVAVPDGVDAAVQWVEAASAGCRDLTWLPGDAEPRAVGATR